MKLQIKNCVTDPRFKELRKTGKPVFKPTICGQVLVPGAVRRVMAAELTQNDVLFLDSLVKSGSCLVSSPGLGFLPDMDSVKAFLGFQEEQKTAPVQEIVEEAILITEEPSLEESEELSNEPKGLADQASSFTEEELNEMRNSDLRDFILSLDPDAAVGNKSKKKLVSLALEIQDEQ